MSSLKNRLGRSKSSAGTSSSRARIFSSGSSSSQDASVDHQQLPAANELKTKKGFFAKRTPQKVCFQDIVEAARLKDDGSGSLSRTDSHVEQLPLRNSQAENAAPQAAVPRSSRPPLLGQVRASRSLSTSPPPANGSELSSFYLQRLGSAPRGSWQRVLAHPKRTPLSATLSDASVHSAMWKKAMSNSSHSKSQDSCGKEEGKNPYLPVELSQQQAEARNLVLSEIKDLQLRRSSSFKRILNRMPHSWTHRTTSPLASSPASGKIEI